MEYKPGDMQKIVDTTIALDIAFTGLITVLNRHDPALAKLIDEQILAAIRSLPAVLPGVEPLLQGWRELLRA